MKNAQKDLLDDVFGQVGVTGSVPSGPVEPVNLRADDLLEGEAIAGSTSFQERIQIVHGVILQNSRRFYQDDGGGFVLSG